MSSVRITEVQTSANLHGAHLLVTKPEADIESLRRVSADHIIGYVTPDMYGSYGDGIHDDAPALQEAMRSGLMFRHVGLFKAVGEIKITDLIENNDRYYIENAQLVGDMLQHVPHNETVTLTNNTGADCYFAFAISGGSEEMLAEIDDLLIVEVGPA